MALEITVPRLGWNMEQGLFAGWLKKDGEAVRAGDSLFRLEGEKATEDVESFDAGILRIPPDGYQEGDTVAVGAVIGYLVQEGETAPFERQEARTPARVIADVAALTAPASPSVRRLARELGVEIEQVAGTGPAGRIMIDDVRRSSRPPVKERVGKRSAPTISPRARQVARELGIDWAHLKGSGRTGRIRERDIRLAASKQGGNLAGVPVSAVRKTIAARMLRSMQSTAPVTLTTTVDATNLVNLRGQFKASAPTADLPVPSYTDFIVKLTATALQKHPLLHARWDGEHIVAATGIHIGVAVDTEAGLFVPVIRDVAGLGLRQLAARSLDLIERARQRKLQAEEMQGGTFTVTNLGAFGVEAFTPIINYPECAILGIGRIQRQAVVRDN
jgi:pyruvate dehydrogenase E2 component (dihydrolipoamide acetyltransferase)